MPGSDCHALFAAGAASFTYPASKPPPPQLWNMVPAELPPVGGAEAFAQPLRLRSAYDTPPCARCAVTPRRAARPRGAWRGGGSEETPRKRRAAGLLKRQLPSLPQ
jgi:hypothetical protein